MSYKSRVMNTINHVIKITSFDLAVNDAIHFSNDFAQVVVCSTYNKQSYQTERNV